MSYALFPTWCMHATSGANSILLCWPACRMGAFSPAQLALTLTGLSRLALASSALADQTALEQVQSSSNSSGSGSRRGRSTQAAQVEQNTVLRPSQRLLHAWFQQAARTSQGFTVLDACQSLSALASLGVVPPAAWLSEVLVSLRPKLVGAPPTSLALLCASLSKLRYKPNWQWMLSFYEATQHAAAVSVSVAESDGPTAAQGAGQGRRSLFGGAEQSDMDAPSGMPLRALGLLLSGLARLQMRPLQVGVITWTSAHRDAPMIWCGAAVASCYDVRAGCRWATKLSSSHLFLLCRPRRTGAPAYWPAYLPSWGGCSGAAAGQQPVALHQGMMTVTAPLQLCHLRMLQRWHRCAGACSGSASCQGPAS